MPTLPGPNGPLPSRRLWRHGTGCGSNQELPEEVFGSGGLFEEACLRIYGAKTGKVMARFFNFFEPLGDDEIPAFYPRKVYPNTVFWRLFQADSAYWGSGSAGSRALEDTEDAATEIRIRGRVRTYSAQDYALLQRRIAAFWRQLAEVNRKGKRMVTEALAAGDVRGGSGAGPAPPWSAAWKWESGLEVFWPPTMTRSVVG